MSHILAGIWVIPYCTSILFAIFCIAAFRFKLISEITRYTSLRIEAPVSAARYDALAHIRGLRWLSIRRRQAVCSAQCQSQCQCQYKKPPVVVAEAKVSWQPC